MKKIISILVFSIITNIVISQSSKYALKFQLNPAITFFEASDFGDRYFKYITYGLKKDNLGKCYSVEFEKKISKKWLLNLGYTTFYYKKNYNKTESFRTVGYEIGGNLRHILSYYSVTAIKEVYKKNNAQLLVGLGLNILSENNQYFEINPTRTFYSLREYKSEEFGCNLNIRYEKKIANRYILGIESKLMYLISTLEFSDLSFGPYIKVDL